LFGGVEFIFKKKKKIKTGTAAKRRFSTTTGKSMTPYRECETMQVKEFVPPQGCKPWVNFSFSVVRWRSMISDALAGLTLTLQLIIICR